MDLEQSREVSRHVEENECSRILTMAMMLYSFPVKSAEALLVFPGLGETWRVEEAIQDWEDDGSEPDCFFHRLLLIAGDNTRETCSGHFTLERLQEDPFNLERTNGVLVQPHAEHTLMQAEWVVEQIRKFDIESLMLYVSPYHLLRAYLTLLKTVKKHGIDWVRIIPNPVIISPKTQIPEYAKLGTSGWDMVPGELARIIKYQEKGDVATFEEFRAYMDWLWENHHG